MKRVLPDIIWSSRGSVENFANAEPDAIACSIGFHCCDDGAVFIGSAVDDLSLLSLEAELAMRLGSCLLVLFAKVRMIRQ